VMNTTGRVNQSISISTMVGIHVFGLVSWKCMELDEIDCPAHYKSWC
jgi:hypothetical protein